MNSLFVKTTIPNISLLLKSSARGLVSVNFVKTDTLVGNQSKNIFHPSSDLEACDSFLCQAKEELEEYFKGSKRQLLTPLDPAGTLFQKSVWDVLRSIPHGDVITYGDVALKIGNSKASRGVGGAVGKNPLPLFIPCHRVLPVAAANAFKKTKDDGKNNG